MGRQLVAMGMGMGIVPGRKRRFCLRVVGRMRLRKGLRVVLFFIVVALLVLAGVRSDVGLRIPGTLSGVVSW